MRVCNDSDEGKTPSILAEGRDEGRLEVMEEGIPKEPGLQGARDHVLPASGGEDSRGYSRCQIPPG